MQYATLTDKAAKDFAPIPGLADVVGGRRADGKTWTYKLRPGLKWSDGQPLTSEDVAYTINRSRREEWLNYSPTTGEHHGHGARPADRRDQVVGVGPEAADDGRLHPPEAHLGEVRQEGDHEVRRRRRRRLWPVHARPSSRRASSRASRRTRTTGAASRAVDEVVFRKFNNATRWSSALQAAASSTPSRTCPAPRSSSSRRTKGITTLQGQQGGFDEFAHQRRRRPEEAATRRCSTRASARRSRHAIDKKTIVDRVLRGLGEPPADTISPSANPAWMPGDPGGPAVRLRPRQGQADPRRRGLQGHRTATASARCRAAASR